MHHVNHIHVICYALAIQRVVQQIINKLKPMEF